MYRSFFRLQRNPFDVHPDTFFMYPTSCHREAMASLYYGIRSHKGFMVLTGEVGTGKTLVLRSLTEQLNKMRIQFAFIFNPMLSPEEFLRYMLADLAVRGEFKSKNELLFGFYGFLAQRQKLGQTTALIVDEAHLLSHPLLEEIRLLGNLENQHGKLLQIALVGQPELDARLDSIELRQLKQRIALRCQLQPLSREQTEQYVNWRLTRAGGNGKAPIFTPEAMCEVYAHAVGYPRLINTICENSLIFACGAQTRTISAQLVMDACKDLRIERRMQPEENASGNPATENDPGDSALLDAASVSHVAEVAS